MKYVTTKTIQLCAISFLVCLVSSCSQKKADGLYTIGMVQITEDPILDLARNNVIAELCEQGFLEGQNIHIDYVNAQGEMPNIALIIKKFISSKVNMIITIGTPCMTAAAQMVRDIPVVFTVSFSPEQIGIKEVPPNLTGAYDTYEKDEFVRMIRACLPSLQRIGILYNPTEPNARYAAEKLREECVKQQIDLVELTVFSSNDILQAAQSLAQKHIQAFSIAADNTVYLAIDALIKVAEARRIPIFVADASQVERGACAGFGVDYSEWGRESGKIAAAIIRGKKPAEIPIKVLQNKIMCLNLKAAAAQGLVFPADILIKADRVIK